MLKEFQEFALKGNMIDLAVGIVIGAAFGAVVSSLVADVITPLIAALFESPDFSNLFVVLRNPTGESFTSVEAAREAGAVVLSFGTFLNRIVAFLLVAVVLFFVVKGINRLRREKTAEAVAAPTPPTLTAQEALLTEIRDLLRAQARRHEETTGAG